MIAEKNHVQELVMTKSINCDSCGAGLTKYVGSTTCKCTYCGNTNIVLENGKTKIIIPDKKLITTDKKQSLSVSKVAMIAIAIGVGLIGVGLYYFMKNRKDNEKKSTKRKRLLLLSK